MAHRHAPDGVHRPVAGDISARGAADALELDADGYSIERYTLFAVGSTPTPESCFNVK